jgi:hypothetical protein
MKIVILIVTTLLALDAAAQVRGTAEDQVKKRVENVKKAITLTAEQEKKVTAIFMATLDKRDEIFAGSRGSRENREAGQEKLLKVKEEENASLKKVLTGEQYTAYLAYLERERAAAEQRRKQVEQQKK